MYKKTLPAIIATMLLATLACAQVTPKPMPGGDADSHGCRASAGYTYSILKNTCIRLWEEKIKLHATKPANAAEFTALVLSKDGKKAEVFIPQTKGSIILDKAGNGTYISKKDNLELSVANGYALKKAGTLIYKLDPATTFITIRAEDDGKTFTLKPNQKFDVVLKECVGCQYKWDISKIDRTKISLLSTTLTNQTACKGCTGGEADHNFHFMTSKKAGTSTLTFTYGQQKLAVSIEVAN